MKPLIFQKGFAALFLAILILAVIFALGISITILTLGQQRRARNISLSSQTFYVAEAGVEDALLRLSQNKNWQSLYTFSVDQGSVTVEISDILGGSRTITSTGDILSRIRKVQTVYQISAEEVSFFYGAQIGDGGILMDNKSSILGNVFSNGSITAQDNTEITGTVWVAQTGNQIDGAKIGQDTYVDICQNSEILGTLTTSSDINCTASSFSPLSEEIAKKDLPISQEQIDQWKTEAVSGGVISGDYILQGQQQASLGPRKIEGRMVIQDKAKLSITGTIWVTDEIVIQNNTEVRLDSNAYGSNSGVVISDGRITLQDDAISLGSGQPGSYLLLISTALGAQAIIIKNFFQADILFAQNGFIVVQDSSRLKEISGFGIHLKNSVKIEYEVGLEDASFTSGPGGGWQVTSWKEIE